MRCSARTAPASRRWSRCSPASTRPTAGAILRNGEEVDVRQRPGRQPGRHRRALPGAVDHPLDQRRREHPARRAAPRAAAASSNGRRCAGGPRSSSTGSTRRSRSGKLAGDLSPVQQTMVAFARALANDARVLILDEPTASLTDTEIKDLFTVLRSLRDAGRRHRLRLAPPRGGLRAVRPPDHHAQRRDDADQGCRRLATSTRSSRRWSAASAGELYPERGTATSEVALAVDDLDGRRVKDVSFTAHKGEVLGIGGLAGSGRSELLRILAGAQKHVVGHASPWAGSTLPHSPGVGRALDARDRAGARRSAAARASSSAPPSRTTSPSPTSARSAPCGIVSGRPHRRYHQARDGRPPDQGAQPAPDGGRALRRQPAEGRAGQDAGPQPEGPADGRAHPRHRRRHQGGDLPAHPRNSPPPAPRSSPSAPSCPS